MRIGAAFSDNPPAVAAIGFFDGVHRGHRYLIGQVCEAAAVRHCATAVVTFPVHPYHVMHPGCDIRLLTTCEEKTALLASMGIDTCVMIDFTLRLAAMPARNFMNLLHRRYHIEALLIGYDHRFGHNRSKGFDDYVRYGRELGMEVLPAQAFRLAGEEGGTELAASSSLIRQLLDKGNVTEAARWLGYRYSLQGTVVRGHRVGRTLGFPTANVQVDSPDKLIPANGVYAVLVGVNGLSYGGMLCIGNRPTLGNSTERSIEVNLFDFHADIYGQPLRLAFVRRIRGEQKYASLETLAARLSQDELEAREILAEEAR